MIYESGFENLSSLARFQSILFDMTDTISRHRKKIDELDAQILDLIEQRVDEAINIRHLKIMQKIPLFTPAREQELINRLVNKSAGHLPAEVIKDIWMTIIKGGKRIGDTQ